VVAFGIFLVEKLDLYEWSLGQEWYKMQSSEPKYRAICPATLPQLKRFEDKAPAPARTFRAIHKTKLKKMKSLLPFWILFWTNLVWGQTTFEKDFEEFWNDIQNHYAYFDQQNVDWNKVKSIYGPQVKEIKSENEFIKLLEGVMNEFHNGHCSLNTNLSSSNRLIPTGQDMFVEKRNTKFYITDLRKGFGAEQSGLKMGSEVLLFNGKSIGEQLQPFLPKSTSDYSQEMYQYALNMLFAGTHDTQRVITVNTSGTQTDFHPDRFGVPSSERLLDQRILNPSTGYIKLNNSLGDTKLIEAFDKAVDAFLSYKNLILDLTETPNGGNTTVARSILGRFIDKPYPYQQHEFDENAFETKRMWIEYVVPRKKQFKGNVYILVGHWTGSMGEGLAIGFDGMNKGTVVGTKMAGLRGAISSFGMTETKIGFQIPTERLYHLNGTPRENYKPSILTNNNLETIKYAEQIK
jgi:carboxyl-terminal processing protease